MKKLQLIVIVIAGLVASICWGISVPSERWTWDPIIAKGAEARSGDLEVAVPALEYFLGEVELLLANGPLSNTRENRRAIMFLAEGLPRVDVDVLLGINSQNPQKAAEFLRDKYTFYLAQALAGSDA